MVKTMGKELDFLTKSEPNYIFSLNVEREMIYNASKPILNQNSFEVAKQYQYKLYEMN